MQDPSGRDFERLRRLAGGSGPNPPANPLLPFRDRDWMIDNISVWLRSINCDPAEARRLYDYIDGNWVMVWQAGGR